MDLVKAESNESVFEGRSLTSPDVDVCDHPKSGDFGVRSRGGVQRLQTLTSATIQSLETLESVRGAESRNAVGTAR